MRRYVFVVFSWGHIYLLGSNTLNPIKSSTGYSLAYHFWQRLPGAAKLAWPVNEIILMPVLVKRSSVF